MEEKKQKQEEQVKFDNLGLSETTLGAVKALGFEFASEIQAKSIPVILEQNSDILGIAQTGTGKTGAFGLPLMDLIRGGHKLPQSIILAPTRELALQVTAELEKFKGKKRLNILTVYGGAPITTQIRTLKRGVDIVVGTPGRVVDIIKRGDLNLSECKHFILDEADEMLKMGFIEDIEFVLSNAAKERRVYLYSATMPDRIKNLSKKYMKNQVIIEVKKKNTTNPLIEQVFYKARLSDKFDALTKIIDFENFFYGIIFCRTKADVDNVTANLKKARYSVDCIHGDIAQAKRETILNKFKEMKLQILVATDVAARGIDAKNLSHVINYTIPEDSETYTHRIGRTGRAGNKGIAISLVTVGELRKLSRFERELKVKIQSKQLPSNKEVLEKKSAKFITEIGELLKKDDIKNYSSIRKELLESFEAETLIDGLLSKVLGVKAEKKRERKSTEDYSDGEDLRIFIAKGKMDKMSKKNLINFIEKETRVRLGDVNDVKICDKFSFLTFNARTAKKVIEEFQKKNPRRPIAEIASKSKN